MTPRLRAPIYTGKGPVHHDRQPVDDVERSPVELTLFSSSFCDPCIQTRTVLAEVERLVPSARVRVVDVALASAESETAAIRSTPTVVVTSDDGTEVFRAVGVPTLAQVLVAAAKAV